LSTGPLVDLVNDILVEHDEEICATLIRLRSLAQPRYPVLLDAEGDIFVDLDADGISDADWRDDLVWDCPHYADFDDPAGGLDGVDGGVVDD
jgi:hypothetical protein